VERRLAGDGRRRVVGGQEITFEQPIQAGGDPHRTSLRQRLKWLIKPRFLRAVRQEVDGDWLSAVPRTCHTAQPGKRKLPIRVCHPIGRETG
jgi:hypothetical protein